MLFADAVLAKKGPLARIWLAAHWERKLSKAQFLQTNIGSSVSAILDAGVEPMALRLTGQLLLGVVRILSRKARYLLEDCSEALMKIKMAFRPGMVDLAEGQTVATVSNITMPESMTEFDILLPEPRIDLATIFAQGEPGPGATVSRLQDITLADNTFLSTSQREDMLIDQMADVSAGVEMGLVARGGPMPDFLGAASPSVARDASVIDAAIDTSAVMTEQEEPVFDLGLGDAPSAIDIEVGRDAAAPLSFLPDTSAAADTTMETSAIADLNGPEKYPTANLTNVPTDLDGDASAIVGGDALNQQVDFVGDDNFDFGFGEPFDLGLQVGETTDPTDAAPAAADASMAAQPNDIAEDGDVTFIVPNRPAAKRTGDAEEVSRKRPATQQRRHRLAIDSEIDMTDAALKRQIRDTSDIRVPASYVPAWRSSQSADMADAMMIRSCMSSQAYQDDMPAVLNPLVAPTESLRRFEFAERRVTSTPNAQTLAQTEERVDDADAPDVSRATDVNMTDIQHGDYDNFDPFQGGDFFEQAPEALNDPSVDVSGDLANQTGAGVVADVAAETTTVHGDDAENIDSNVDNQVDAEAGPLKQASAVDLSVVLPQGIEVDVDADNMLPAAAEAAEGSYLEVSVDELAEGNMARGTSLMGRETTRPRLFDFDESEAVTTTDADTDTGLSKHTAQTVAILKDTFNGDVNAELVQYSSIVQNASRATAARFFFELLVLKTKNMIDVEQKKAYGEIDIIPKAKLFSVAV